ncbi:thiamine diphosphate-binding protein [Pluteus cervinus]|uniref:Thiamine diphosphate-binding protein n=1 Tax=Pluteus cervinus TaxID=181527 RepID=A0ACD3AJP2_9AGAR|nr:thiamine diphosphate-binding protein [Pluteus cervinus]
MLTGSSVFLKSLADAGITHAFVNWGSDHPAMLEELERLRVEHVSSGGRKPIEVITCPNEMVALSAAQGYAQVTGKPAAVIIHVDVGTQALAGAIHNVDRSRVPVLIYAGASPFSAAKEHKGTRNEWIMWLQDIPDQSAIVRQYMRYTAQLQSAATIPQYIRRALQIATSEPKGPVYLWARREVMEEEVTQELLNPSLDLSRWPAVEPSALSASTVSTIASALLDSKSPLIITSFLGRSSAVPVLHSLASLLSIPVVSSCPSCVNIPSSSVYDAGVTYLATGTHSPYLQIADVILVIDCDLPWIPVNDSPSSSSKVFVIDGGDPLKKNVGFWHVEADLVGRADAELALHQIVQAVRESDERLQKQTPGESILSGSLVKERLATLTRQHRERLADMEKAETTFPDLLSAPVVASAGGEYVAGFTVPNLLGVLRRSLKELAPNQGNKTLILNEAISSYPLVWSHLRPETPGSIITSGGSSLGWALGGAVGAHLGAQALGELGSGKTWDLIVTIVGDGSFLFGVPSSAYWMAQKYNAPFLTIVLNNGGWKSPKLSMMSVHPTGHGSKVSGERLSTGFGPTCPDYSQIAVAASAGWAWGKRIGGENRNQITADPDFSYPKLLESTIKDAIRVVLQENRCAVVDCVLEGF